MRNFFELTLTLIIYSKYLAQTLANMVDKHYVLRKSSVENGCQSI